MTTNFTTGRKIPFLTCLSMFLLCTIYAGSATAQVVNIPDENFKAALLADANININGDDEIQVSEAEAYTGLIKANYDAISDLTGIEAFIKLTALKVQHNNLNTVDVSANTLLEELHIQGNQLTSLDLSSNPEIVMLRLQGNLLTSLDVSANTKLRHLEVNNNNLSSLNVQNGNNSAMYSKFEAEGNPKLTCVQVDDASEAEFEWWDNVDQGVSFSTDCPSEPVVYIPDANFKAALLADENINMNGDDEIQVSETEGITKIDASGAGVTDPTGVGEFLQLVQLNFDDNNLTSLDVTDMGLTSLSVSNNELHTLVLGPVVEYLYATGNPDLTCIQTGGPDYYDNDHGWGEVDEGVIFSTDCSSNEPVVHIPDAYFKGVLVSNPDINTNGDDEIQVSEASAVDLLDVSGSGISDLTGIEAFTGLKALYATHNNLTALDVSSNEELLEVNLSYNQVAELLLPANIYSLNALQNNLTTLDVSHTQLAYIAVPTNNLTSLNIQTGSTIKQLYAVHNPELFCVQVNDVDYAESNFQSRVDEGVIFSTDCSSEEPVVYIPDANFKAALLADENINTNGDDEIQVSETEGVTDIDASGAGVSDPTGVREFHQLVQLNFDDNNLTALDVTDMGLTSLSVRNNQLNSLVLGNIVEYLLATGNPDLTCIQTDEPDYYDNDHGWGEVDEGVVFSTDCKYGEPVVYIPDENFKAALLADEKINTNGDDEIQVSETEGVTDIDASGAGVSDPTGVGEFLQLVQLNFDNNNLTSLDVTDMGLTSLSVSNNELNTLILGPVVEYLYAPGNPDLTCIQTGGPDYYDNDHGWGEVDEGVIFSTDCNAEEPVVHIPDANFKDVLVSNPDINTNGDDEIQVSEAEAFDGRIKAVTEGITDLTGIEAFTSLTDLRVHYNNLTSVDLSANTNLKQLHIQNNKLTSLDLSSNSKLDMLRAQNNNLTALDVSANTKLRYLEVTNNDLNSLNVQNGNNTEMYKFLAKGNPRLTCVQVDDVTYAEENWSDNVDEGVSFSTSCGDPVVYIPDETFKAYLVSDPDINWNEDDEIQVHEAEAVTILQAYSVGISDLTGIEAFTNLGSLYADDNNLTTVDLSSNPALQDVNLSNNQLTEIKIHPNIESLAVGGNQLTSLDLSGTAIRTLVASDNDLVLLNIRNGIVGDWLYAAGNPDLSCIEVDDVEHAEANWSENVDEGVVFSTDCSSLNTVVDIPDANFKAALLADENININGDSEIQVNEAQAFTGLIKVNGENISDLTGIEAFVNLTELKAHYNNLISVDLSANQYLVELHIQNNQLTSLDLSSNPELDLLRAQHNNLSSLDVSGNTKLRHLEVNNNNLNTLNVKNGNNSTMYKFEAGGNPDLTCIEVDDAVYASDNWSDNVDAGASFSEDCSGSSSARLAGSGTPMENSLDVSVFPNPSADFMQVSSDATLDELHVYSVNGEEMDVRFVNGEADIRHLNTGVYILKAYKGGEVSTVRIVKR